MPWTRPPHPLPLLAAAFTALAPPAPASAQDLRVVIVVPDLVPAEGIPEKFGRQVAEELRKRIESPEHRAFGERELKAALKRYGVDEDDFDCLTARQLAVREQLQLAFCGHYREGTGGWEFFDVAFVAPAGNARFDVPPFTARDREEAAQRIVDAFQQYARQLALLRNCNDYVGSEQWERALANCNDALALNPDYLPALELKGNILREMDRLEEAYAIFQRVVEASPLSQANLYNAGWVASRLERSGEARSYFERYLELMPGDVAVRLTIAHELATGGDELGALELAEAGLREFAADSAVLTLAEFAGHYAKNAGNAVRDGVRPPPPGVTAADLYQRALAHYTTVYEGRGSAASPDILRNMVLMYRETGRVEDAVAFAEEALATHGEDAGLWWVYATVLADAGRQGEAREAVERVTALDPAFPGAWPRLATLVIGAGELEAATRAVAAAVEAGGPGDQLAAMMIANAGYKQFAEKDRHREALRWYAAARPFATEATTRAMADFFEGYSVLKLAGAAQAPTTCASARATLPEFRRARELLTGSTAYATPSRAQVVAAAEQFISVQEAVLKQPACR